MGSIADNARERMLKQIAGLVGRMYDAEHKLEVARQGAASLAEDLRFIVDDVPSTAVTLARWVRLIGEVQPGDTARLFDLREQVRHEQNEASFGKPEPEPSHA